MISEPFTLRDAVITAIDNTMKDGKVQARVHVYGTLNQEVAAVLGAQSLCFANNGTPKEGFKSLQLDTGCAAFRAVIQADPALKQNFELSSGDHTDSYVVRRQAEGHLKLELRLNYHGSSIHLQAFWEAVGSSELLLKIVPLQVEMDGDEVEDSPKTNAEYDAEEEQKEEEKEHTISATAVRQALIGHRRPGRKQATQ